MIIECKILLEIYCNKEQIVMKVIDKNKKYNETVIYISDDFQVKYLKNKYKLKPIHRYNNNNLKGRIDTAIVNI